MNVPDFPGNSKKRPVEEKVVEQVTVGEVVSQKKTVGKRLREALIGGDSQSVASYIITEVVVPQVKDLITEAVTQGFERLVYGDGRSSRRPSVRPGHAPTNYTRYGKIGNNPIGRASREDRPTPVLQSKNMDDILLATRPEADEVLDRMSLLIDEYGAASISDLYKMVGWTASHVDTKWGWESIQGCDVRRARGEGYVLNLTKPIPLD
jgi:hypothetical protein